jgi:hypothetical protein
MNTVRRPVAEPGATGQVAWGRHMERCATPLSNIQCVNSPLSWIGSSSGRYQLPTCRLAS